jgi:thiol:disulfide interchange protein DsbD
MHPQSLSPRSAPLRAWLFLLAALFALGAARAADGFLEPEQAFRLQVEPGAGGTVALRWTIAPGYYLYRDRLTIAAAAGGPIGKITRPAGVQKVDPNFGAVEIYHDAVRVDVDPGAATALAVRWQGCAEQGLCYPPQQRTVRLDGAAAAPPAGGAGGFGVPGLSPDVAAALQSPPPSAAAPVAVPAQAPAPMAADLSTDSGISRLWSGHGLWWSLPFAFVLGIGLAFTPCVLPMVPILSAMVVGQQARGGVRCCCRSPSCSRWRWCTRRSACWRRWRAPACRPSCRTRGPSAPSRRCSRCWPCRCSASTNCSCRPGPASG